MSENIYAAPESSFSAVGLQPGESPFYVVSLRKLTIMYLGTMGLYFLYWFYKHWDQYKYSQLGKPSARKIVPVLRAFFSVFFIHVLYRDVKAAMGDHPLAQRWAPMLEATLLLVVLLLPLLLPRVPALISLPVAQVLGLLLLLPTLLLLRRLQVRVNAFCGDAEGQSNNGLTGANIGWLVFGGLMWLMTAVALLAMFTGAAGTEGGGF